MAERSPAQKAATRRMIAANRRGRKGGGGGRRSSGGGRGFNLRSHRRGVGHVTHISEPAGAVAGGYGLLKYQVGGDDPITAAQQGRWTDVKSQLKQRLVFWGSNANAATGQRTAQALTYGGMLFASGAGGKLLRKIPVVRGVFRHLKFKDGRHTYSLA